VDRAETAFKDRVKDVCVKPFKLLVLEPILQAMTLYMWVCRRPGGRSDLADVLAVCLQLGRSYMAGE
jgi:hypothetical protein